MEEIRYLIAGDAAVVVEFGNQIDEKINQKVRALAEMLKEEPAAGVLDMIPTFRSLMVCFHPQQTTRDRLLEELKQRCSRLSEGAGQVKRVIEIPVCYGARFGTDLKDVSAHTGLSCDEIIHLHSGRDYRIYMLGFLPGFSYLGGMDARLVTPRLSNPRVRIAAGSVGIGGEQTGIYPLDSPGGWRLIGATPVRTYDPDREEPILFSAGEYLRFVPISLFDYYDIRRMVERGEYYCRVFEDGRELQGRLAGVRGQEFDSGLTGTGWMAEAGHSKFLQVVLPGMLTTVQDQGRIGYQCHGFSVSGVMDFASYAYANALVGNPPSAAVLECTMLGPTLTAGADMTIAVTGADMQPTLNDQVMPMNQAVQVRAGDTIALGMAANGCRAYLAAAGGINTVPQMGSRSTYMKCRIGGYYGRKLAAGDCLPIGDDLTEAVNLAADHTLIADRQLPDDSRKVADGKVHYSAEHLRQLQKASLEAVQASREQEVILRVIPGPQEEYFTEEGKRTLYHSSYCLTEHCDRMGYKLEGAAVEAVQGVDIISDGIAFGAIQIPPNGKPIIMLADRQTTGGYAKPGTVSEADLPKLAQLRPGARIRFQRL